MYLPRHEKMTELFVEEAESFPVGVNDDLLDTYTMCMEEITHGGSNSAETAKRKRATLRITGGFVESDGRGVSGGF